MTDSQFDQIIRDKLLSIECEVDDALWDGIVAKMAARDRRRARLRIAFGSVAAAACVALGVFLFNGDDVTSQLQSAPEVAVAVQPVIQDSGDAAAVPSIAEQIKALRSGNAVAEALPVESADAAKAVTVESPAAGQQTAADVAEDKAETGKQPAQGASEPSAAQPRNNYRTPTGGQLMDDFYLFEDEQDAKQRTHATLSISSNVSGIAKQDGFILQMAPSHSASANGNAGGTVVEELTESSYMVPLSFGVQMRFPVTDKFSVGAGANYTYLQRNFSAMVNREKFTNASSRLHYAGLTASLYYDFIQEGRLSVYGRAGGAVDKAVSAKYIFGDYSMNQDARGVQWSVNAGVGVEYRIAAPVAVFIDPSASYYFDCAQPKSIRTEQPLMFSLEAGVRFHL